MFISINDEAGSSKREIEHYCPICLVYSLYFSLADFELFFYRNHKGFLYFKRTLYVLLQIHTDP